MAKIKYIEHRGEEHEIEPEIAAKHLSKPIIEKIESEGRSFNLLPKKAKLPI